MVFTVNFYLLQYYYPEMAINVNNKVHTLEFGRSIICKYLTIINTNIQLCQEQCLINKMIKQEEP